MSGSGRAGASPQLPRLLLSWRSGRLSPARPPARPPPASAPAGGSRHHNERAEGGLRQPANPRTPPVGRPRSSPGPQPAHPGGCRLAESPSRAAWRAFVLSRLTFACPNFTGICPFYCASCCFSWLFLCFQNPAQPSRGSRNRAAAARCLLHIRLGSCCLLPAVSSL